MNSKCDLLLHKAKDGTITLDEKIELIKILKFIVGVKIKKKDNWGALYVTGILGRLQSKKGLRHLRSGK